MSYARDRDAHTRGVGAIAAFDGGRLRARRRAQVMQALGATRATIVPGRMLSAAPAPSGGGYTIVNNPIPTVTPPAPDPNLYFHGSAFGTGTVTPPPVTTTPPMSTPPPTVLDPSTVAVATGTASSPIPSTAASSGSGTGAVSGGSTGINPAITPVTLDPIPDLPDEVSVAPTPSSSVSASMPPLSATTKKWLMIAGVLGGAYLLFGGDT